MIVLGRDQTSELRAARDRAGGQQSGEVDPGRFHVTDIGLGEVATATDNFVAP